MYLLPEKRNVLDGFYVNGHYPSSIKERIDQIIEETITPNNLHLIRGASGPEYMHANSTRFTDRLLGSGASVVSAPIAVVVAAAIKHENPNYPVTYSGNVSNPRVSRVKPKIQRARLFGIELHTDDLHATHHIEPALMHKFLSMAPGADAKHTPGKKAENSCSAAEITKVGKAIRPLKIDEIPQLWDIAAGRFSITGKRPVLANELSGSDLFAALDYSNLAREAYLSTYSEIPDAPIGFVEVVHHQEVNSADDWEWRVAADTVYATIASNKTKVYMTSVAIGNAINRARQSLRTE